MSVEDSPFESTRQRLRFPRRVSRWSRLFVLIMYSLSLLAVLDRVVRPVEAVLTAAAVMEYFPSNGMIDDAKCNIEDLEKANDSQLHVILQELKSTAFFKHFVVDLDHKCPLRTWRKSSAASDDPADDEQEEEFECNGGDGESDEDAEPLCTVAGSDDPLFSSNALYSLSQGGFESKAQKDTFAWKQQTDMVVAEEEEPCDSALLPDSFWIDMCSNIKAGDGTSLVNLALNPERNTFYNGTHIWRAIYEENCIFAPPSGTSSLDALTGTDRGMCLEERVLYRLLSGLHTSTTLSIAMNYYPPSKIKNRTDWEANPDYFMEKFKDHPDHIRNLHFSYVVLLRALQKASPYLHEYEIRTGDIVEDETAATLLDRLLDTAILKSCSSVFSAFDESLMFREQSNLDVASLQKNFKGVFHNVSSILDCVQCQQCKLHGKLTMTGYGAALKILFMRNEKPELSRNEIVALINTLAKFSESLHHVRELTHMFLSEQEKKIPIPEPVPPVEDHVTGSIDRVDTAVETVAELGKEGLINWDREAELVRLALNRNPEVLILAKHYGANHAKFLELTQAIGEYGESNAQPDAIVVGSGLAGLAASLNILDRGGSVVIIEKEHLLGGNSNKASSGINACCPNENYTDTLELFKNDTIRSAGSSAHLDLIETLVSRSADAVAWLKDRVGVDLSLTAQLGGHSAKRTHRPSNGMVGAEIIFGMQKAVRSYEKTGKAKILVDTKVTKLISEAGGRVVGVEYKSSLGEGPTEELRAPNVILATGGFASDRSRGSYLEQYRPELLKMPTTAGAFSTGDGITLATALGAGTADMNKVQVHPTGWVDPADPENTSKILAAELMRGVGGLLINGEGKRFCNELGTRAYVTKQMLSHDEQYAKTGEWDVNHTVPTFSLVLSSSAAADGKKHVDLYTHKRLLTRIEGVTALSSWMGLPKSTVLETLRDYQKASAKKGTDEFGKSTFRGVPAEDLESEVFYAGKVTPVLHYCMGGITIDTEGNVLNEKGEPIPGLHAAGEVTGGVHGVNRLAGNSLLECTVFGSMVGKKIPIKSPSSPVEQENKVTETETKPLRPIPLSELQQHSTPEDCWVAIHGAVYDLTEFADEHPAGATSIHELAGKDGTEAFAAVHNEKVMEDFEKIGVLKIKDEECDSCKVQRPKLELENSRLL